ncbi:MAG: glycosyltransferase 87 family protein [Pseudomonadota bacterium]
MDGDAAAATTERGRFRASILDGREFLLAALILAILAFAWLVYSSHLKPSTLRHGDFRFLYAAGATWLEGQSPYDLEAYRGAWIDTIFQLPDDIRPYPEVDVTTRAAIQDPGIMNSYMYPYPPVSAGLVVPLAALGWQGATVTNALLGYGAALAIAFLLGRQCRLTAAETTALAALTFICASTSAAIFGGQPTLFAILGVCLAAAPVVRHEGSSLPLPLGFLFGLGCALAFIKPTVTLLFLAYLWLVSRQKLALAAWGGGLVVLSMAVPLISIGDTGFLGDYSETLKIHGTLAFNRYAHHDGILAILATEMPQRAALAICLAIGLGALVGVARAGISLAGGLAITALLSTLLLPVKFEYDLGVALPLFAFAVMAGGDAATALARSDVAERPAAIIPRLAALAVLGFVVVALLRWSNFSAGIAMLSPELAALEREAYIAMALAALPATAYLASLKPCQPLQSVR